MPPGHVPYQRLHREPPSPGTLPLPPLTSVWIQIPPARRVTPSVICACVRIFGLILYCMTGKPKTLIPIGNVHIFFFFLCYGTVDTRLGAARRDIRTRVRSGERAEQASVLIGSVEQLHRVIHRRLEHGELAEDN